MSFENTDRELVRFVATRTSVRDAFLAPDDLSALLRAFTGRSVVALPGAMSKKPAARHVAMTRALYGTEEELYETCRTAHIDYVVYSIDVLLDSGRYSPRYLAGVAAVDPASIAYKMHFEPESLQRFTLQYENDHYRLFSVSGTPQPIFATDHPPFYQTDLLAKANRDIDAFRQLAVQVMLTYAEASEGARARERRGRATPARVVPAASTALHAGAHGTRRRAHGPRSLRRRARVWSRSSSRTRPTTRKRSTTPPIIAAQLGKADEAKSYLTLLLSIERDPPLIERAKALQSAIEQGVPLRKGAPPQRLESATAATLVRRGRRNGGGYWI